MNESDEMAWLQEEVWHGLQEWKEVDRLEESVVSQDEKTEKPVVHLQTLPAVCHRSKIAGGRVALEKGLKLLAVCRMVVGHAARRWKEWAQKDSGQA